MNAAMAMPGNTADTFLVHFFGNRHPNRDAVFLAGAGQGNRGGAPHRVIAPVTINTVLTRGPKSRFVRSNMSGGACRRFHDMYRETISMPCDRIRRPGAHSSDRLGLRLRSSSTAITSRQPSSCGRP